MDTKHIKEIITAMEKGGIKRVRIKGEKGNEIEIERFDEHAPATHIVRSEPAHHFASASNPRTPVEEKGESKESHAKFITSPMVGTFYTAASPEDAAFVKVGDSVNEDSVVCIIEAMKVMNEVKAGKKGKIIEIYMNNAEPVEFGTKLFRIV